MAPCVGSVRYEPLTRARSWAAGRALRYCWVLLKQQSPNSLPWGCRAEARAVSCTLGSPIGMSGMWLPGKVVVARNACVGIVCEERVAYKPGSEK